MIGNSLRKLVALAIIIGTVGCSEGIDSGKVQQDKLSVVPYPNKILKRSGSIELSDDFWVVADVSDPASSRLAGYLVSQLKTITKQDVLITDLFSTRKHAQSILLEISQKKSDSEAYTLDITSTHIKINSESTKGAFYGMQTLLSIFSNSRIINNKFSLQKMVIKDFPVMEVRGLLFSPAQVSAENMAEHLAMMSKLKLNTLFLSSTIENQQELESLARTYFIDVKIFERDNNEINLVTYGSDTNELEKFYTSYNASKDSKGLVLDLSTSDLQGLQNKSVALADLSWTQGNHKDYQRVSSKFSK